MSHDTVECFNCGRPNPEWAHVCRHCGVALRATSGAAPAGRIPTDRDSLIAIGAVLATILAGIVVGLMATGINPTEPTVGRGSPTPHATMSLAPTPSPTLEATPPPSLAPSVEPTPSLPGTLTFGTGLDGEKQVTNPTDTFTPSDVFAHSFAMPEPFGVPAIREGVYRIADDGTEGVVQDPSSGTGLGVDPAATRAGFAVQAGGLVQAWGPGQYVMRVFINDELVAEAPFILAEG